LNLIAETPNELRCNRFLELARQGGEGPLPCDRRDPAGNQTQYRPRGRSVLWISVDDLQLLVLQNAIGHRKHHTRGSKLLRRFNHRRAPIHLDWDSLNAAAAARYGIAVVACRSFLSTVL